MAKSIDMKIIDGECSLNDADTALELARYFLEDKDLDGYRIIRMWDADSGWYFEMGEGSSDSPDNVPEVYLIEKDGLAPLAVFELSGFLSSRKQEIPI